MKILGQRGSSKPSEAGAIEEELNARNAVVSNLRRFLEDEFEEMESNIVPRAASEVDGYDPDWVDEEDNIVDKLDRAKRDYIDFMMGYLIENTTQALDDKLYYDVYHNDYD